MYTKNPHMDIMLPNFCHLPLLKDELQVFIRTKTDHTYSKLPFISSTFASDIKGYLQLETALK